MKKILFASLVVFSLAVAGCNKGDSDVIESSDPAVREITFAGQPDDSLVGVWKNDKSNIRYTFEKSGKYTNKGKVNSPAGEMTIDNSGDWGFEKDTLYVKDAKGSVMDYTATVAGNKLKLVTRGEKKIESNYTKE
jgi:hypothetical protein